MAVLARWLILLSLPFCSAMVVSGYDEDYWWTHPLENFAFRTPIIQHPWNGHRVARRPKDKTEHPEETNVDMNRFGQKRFRLTERLNEAQIQEDLTTRKEERSKEVTIINLAQHFHLSPIDYYLFYFFSIDMIFRCI